MNKIIQDLFNLNSMISNHIKIVQKSVHSIQDKQKKIKIINIILSTLITIISGLNIAIFGEKIILVLSAVSTGIIYYYNINETKQLKFLGIDFINKAVIISMDILYDIQSNKNLHQETVNDYKNKFDKLYLEYINSTLEKYLNETE